MTSVYKDIKNFWYEKFKKKKLDNKILKIIIV